MTGEHAALLGLMRRSALADPAHREDLLAHPDAIRLPPEPLEGGDMLVAELDIGVAGFAALAGGAVEAELDALFVEPALWRRGVGRALVEAAARQAAQRGATRLRVVAGFAAEGFYRACGFIPAGTVATRFGPAQAMLLALPAG